MNLQKNNFIIFVLHRSCQRDAAGPRYHHCRQLQWQKLLVCVRRQGGGLIYVSRDLFRSIIQPYEMVKIRKSLK